MNHDERTPSDESQRWNDWIDDDAEELCLPGDLGDRRRLADLLFVDGLLAEAHDTDFTKRERRLTRLMAALDREAPEPSIAAPSLVRRTRWNVPRWGISIALAAAVIVGTFSLFQGSGINAAHAAVEQAYRHASRSEDRIYQITTELQRQSSTKLIVATLFTRGASQFTIRQPSLFGSEIWLGSDGESNWIVPPIGPVLKGPETKWLRKWMNEREVEIPYMQVTSVLAHLMEDQYRIELRPDEELPGRGGVRWHYIHATRTMGKPFLPHSVDLWVHPETGAVERMVLDWKHPLTKLGVRQMRFERMPDEMLPTGWYRHDPHHEADREVIDLGMLSP